MPLELYLAVLAAWLKQSLSLSLPLSEPTLPRTGLLQATPLVSDLVVVHDTDETIVHLQIPLISGEKSGL